MKSLLLLATAKIRPELALLLVLLTVPLIFTACAGDPEPIPEPVPVPEPTPEPEPTPDPFFFDWGGTTWILKDPDTGSKDYPGYRGFHLGRDGRLLFINLNEAVGDTWTAEENSLTFTLYEGLPSLPLSGRFTALIPNDDPDSAAEVRMLLVPEELPGHRGLVFELATVNVDIVENHWIPQDMAEGDSVMWPMSREIHLMLLPDATGGMGVLGYGGENRFRGPVELDEDTFVISRLASTRKVGPATPFENLYMKNLTESTRYVQVEDDLFLYQDSRPKAAFRVRLFD